MIILDTNQIFYLQLPGGPLATALKNVSRSIGHTIGMPELVLEEYMAQYRHELDETISELIRCQKRLRHVIPGWIEREGNPQADEAERKRRASIEEMVTILEAPDSAHKEAMLREARRKVPAKTDWNNPGSGARDAVIWLTALHACRDRQEDVYFVSANTKDFGKGELKKDLVDEARTLLGDNYARFHYYDGIESFLYSVGKVATHPLNKHDLIRNEVVVESVAEALGRKLPVSVVKHHFSTVTHRDSISDLRLISIEGIAGNRQSIAWENNGKTLIASRALWGATQEFAASYGEWGPDYTKILSSFKAKITVVLTMTESGSVESANVVDIGPFEHIRNEYEMIDPPVGYGGEKFVQKDW